VNIGATTLKNNASNLIPSMRLEDYAFAFPGVEVWDLGIDMKFIPNAGKIAATILVREFWTSGEIYVVAQMTARYILKSIRSNRQCQIVLRM
jgi:hypothetical protein